MDQSTSSVLLLFTANLLLLLVMFISFNIIRRFRGDKVKVKMTKKVARQLGYDDENNELMQLLLENPTRSMIYH
jgi:hypothetical protein